MKKIERDTVSLSTSEWRASSAAVRSSFSCATSVVNLCAMCVASRLASFSAASTSESLLKILVYKSLDREG